MKQLKKPIGVTVLEIMLFLAIGALLIIMSVRYYDYARIHQQADSVLDQIHAITAAADNLAQGTSSYAGSVTTSTIRSVLPTHGLVAPWGANIEITGSTSSSYTVSIPAMPAQICALMKLRLASNSHYDLSAVTCPAAGLTGFVYTFSRGAGS